MALTGKTMLFAGSDGGAEQSAVASLIETCRLNTIEPHAHFADIITRIVNGHPNNRVDGFLPWACLVQPDLSDVA